MRITLFYFFGQFDITDAAFPCNGENDLNVFEEETLTSPVLEMECFSIQQIETLTEIENQFYTDILGYDHYSAALNFINSQHI